jgi:periplasmic protein TonB
MRLPQASGYVDCEMMPPEYPKPSRLAQESGTARIHFEVSPAGNIENITVAQSSGHEDLDDSAVTALRASRCSPYYENGKPTRAAYTQPYTFSPERTGVQKLLSGSTTRGI